MGFRSTFTTSDYSIKWPEWFKEKYRDTVAFRENGVGALHSIFEYKTYMTWGELHTDIQKAIDWNDFGEDVKYGRILIRIRYTKNEVTRQEWRIGFAPLFCSTGLGFIIPSNDC